MKILVTGATGFVGRALLADLKQDAAYQVCALTRHGSASLDPEIQQFRVESINGIARYSELLVGIDVVIHTAARVHQMHDRAVDPYSAYQEINVTGTLSLASAAAQAGVQRFIFLSSVKVNGETSRPGHPFEADDLPAPHDPYALTKYEAELKLLDLAENTGMEVVIVRPPLIYGPGVKANFHRLMTLVHKGYPLPLRLIDNRRSLVSLGNLVSLIQRCIDHPQAANETFLVADGEDVSTPELIRRIASAMHLPCRMLPITPLLLRTGAMLLGRSAEAESLLCNLQVDITKTRQLLGWQPPETISDALDATVMDYLQRCSSASRYPITSPPR